MRHARALAADQTEVVLTFGTTFILGGPKIGSSWRQKTRSDRFARFCEKIGANKLNTEVKSDRPVCEVTIPSTKTGIQIVLEFSIRYTQFSRKNG